MPIREDQRKRRAERIGSSDSPAIVGVDPWRNAHDVYLTKRYDTTEASEERKAAREAIEIGNDFERPLLRWASEQLGVEIQENVECVRRDKPIFAANHDALVVNRPIGLEAKTGGEDWGAEGTDEVPDRVLVQAQHQCFVSDLEVVWVPVLTARFDRLVRVMYRVERNEALIKAVVQRDEEFWERHVLAGTPPIDLTPSLDTLKAMRRVPNTTVVADEQLVAIYREAQRGKKSAEAAEETAKARLIASMGDAEGLLGPDGKLIFRYLPETRTTIDSKTLKLQAPETYEQFARQTTSPVLRAVGKKTQDQPREESA